jgi:hypothetical protein
MAAKLLAAGGQFGNFGYTLADGLDILFCFSLNFQALNNKL